MQSGEPPEGKGKEREAVERREIWRKKYIKNK